MSYPTLKLDGTPVTNLSVGDDVLVMSIVGRQQAKVTCVEEKTAQAEDEHTIYRLEREDDQWGNHMSASKKGVAEFLKHFKG